MNIKNKTSKVKILLELKRYKKGYKIAMENFEKWDDDTRKDVHKQLKKIDL